MSGVVQKESVKIYPSVVTVRAAGGSAVSLSPFYRPASTSDYGASGASHGTTSVRSTRPRSCLWGASPCSSWWSDVRVRHGPRLGSPAHLHHQRRPPTPQASLQQNSCQPRLADGIWRAGCSGPACWWRNVPGPGRCRGLSLLALSAEGGCHASCAQCAHRSAEAAKRTKWGWGIFSDFWCHSSFFQAMLHF